MEGNSGRWIVIAGTLACVVQAVAQNWATVQLVEHRVFQAVNESGGSAYTGGFPVRLRGVLLNNPEDWLDATPGYTDYYDPWNLGGEWEIFVQAAAEPDFGGTACWMGQNYGNLPWLGDPFYSYTDPEWLAEMERLNLPEGPGTEPIRAGDYLEIRARAGLPYAGKMNVNEQHNNDRDPETGLLGTAHDFEIVILQRGYGLPTPAQITLSDLLYDTGSGFDFVWDPTRQTGGEHFQAARVLIVGVQLVDGAAWGTDSDAQLVDETGRTLNVHLGRDPNFDTTAAPTTTFNVTGVLNQQSQTGRGGYSLLAFHVTDLVCGDANCDGQCDFGDINPFVLALSDPAGYAASYPGCLPDMTGDFAVGFGDINPFVTALTGGGACP